MSILVVDDIPYMRELFSLALRHSGYNVIEAGSGTEALIKFKQNHQDVSLMVVDWQLYDWSGKQLIEHIWEINPNIKTILVSAYDLQELKQTFANTPVDAILEKPMSMKMLRQAVALHNPLSA